MAERVRPSNYAFWWNSNSHRTRLWYRWYKLLVLERVFCALELVTNWQTCLSVLWIVLEKKLNYLFITIYGFKFCLLDLGSGLNFSKLYLFFISRLGIVLFLQIVSCIVSSFHWQLQIAFLNYTQSKLFTQLYPIQKYFKNLKKKLVGTFQLCRKDCRSIDLLIYVFP